MPIETHSDYERKALCANEQSLNLHVALRCHANERVKINAKGLVELKLKSPWRHDITYPVMSPLEFMQRLTAMVPEPRLHLIRFHGA